MTFHHIAVTWSKSTPEDSEVTYPNFPDFIFSSIKELICFWKFKNKANESKFSKEELKSPRMDMT